MDTPDDSDADPHFDEQGAEGVEDDDEEIEEGDDEEESEGDSKEEDLDSFEDAEYANEQPAHLKKHKSKKSRKSDVLSEENKSAGSPELPKRIKKLGYQHHSETKTKYQPKWIPVAPKAMDKSLAEKAKNLKAEFLKKKLAANGHANGKAAAKTSAASSSSSSSFSSSAAITSSNGHRPAAGDDVQIVSIHRPPATTTADALAGFKFIKKPRPTPAPTAGGDVLDLTNDEVILPESPYKPTAPPAAAQIASPDLLSSGDGSPSVAKVSRWQRLKPASSIASATSVLPVPPVAAPSSVIVRPTRASDDPKLPCEICQKPIVASKLEVHQNQCAAHAERKRKLDELAFVKVNPIIDIDDAVERSRKYALETTITLSDGSDENSEGSTRLRNTRKRQARQRRLEEHEDADFRDEDAQKKEEEEEEEEEDGVPVATTRRSLLKLGSGDKRESAEKTIGGGTGGEISKEKAKKKAKGDEEKNNSDGGADDYADEVSDIEDVIDNCEALGKKITAYVEKEKDKIITQPSALKHPLKDYQLTGLNWLFLMHTHSMNGILADEMGLGKTIQTIAFIALLVEKGTKGPNLIIVPSTTLQNWMREFKTWAPSLNVCCYWGSQKEREQARIELLESSDPLHAMVTTYNIAFQKNDRSFLKKFKFDYLILDEAHNIKNVASIRHQRLNRFPAKRRLLLTGTPLQNNLKELCALLNFLMPKLFKNFAHEDNAKYWGNASDPKKCERMKKILAPFMLRRLKTEVQQNLKPKMELVEQVRLDTGKQRDLYVQLLQHTSAEWTKNIKTDKTDIENLDLDDVAEKTGPGRPKKNSLTNHFVNNILIQLQKACSHPALCRTFYSESHIEQIAKVLHREEKEYWDQDLRIVLEDMAVNSDFELHQICLAYKELNKLKLTNEQLFESSGKFVHLKPLLSKLKEKSHRVLIFSQMTRVLDILELFMSHLKYRFLRLDGQTPVVERMALIDNFNNDKDIFVFLLSTKAGGLGINLTSADTVIFFDTSFNPQNDRQAEDRCHRIGQEKPVIVYRLICQHTVEEYILSRAKEKLALNDAVLDEGTDKDKSKKEKERIHKMLQSALQETKML